MDLRRIGLVAACGVLLLGCSDGGGDRAGGSRSTTTAAKRVASGAGAGGGAKPTGGSPSPTSTSVPAESVSAAEARDLLTVLAPVVPIPADARACVAEGVAKDPGLAAELKAKGAMGSVPDGVMELGSACMDELHALPALLDGLDAQVKGGLSGAQRACVAAGYRQLDPEAVDAAVADALGAERGVKAAGDLESVLRRCGVKVGS